jgi:hypothetical protein
MHQWPPRRWVLTGGGGGDVWVLRVAAEAQGAHGECPQPDSHIFTRWGEATLRSPRWRGRRTRRRGCVCAGFPLCKRAVPYRWSRACPRADMFFKPSPPHGGVLSHLRASPFRLVARRAEAVCSLDAEQCGTRGAAAMHRLVRPRGPSWRPTPRRWTSNALCACSSSCAHPRRPSSRSTRRTGIPRRHSSAASPLLGSKK